MSFSYTKPAHFMAPAVLLISLLLRWVSPATSLEQIYSRGIFPLLRTLWDYTLGFSPIPLYYLFWLGVLLLLIRGIRRLHIYSGKEKWLAGLGKLLRFACWLLIVFLWGWGFNYGRVSVEEQLNFTPYELSFAELTDWVQQEAATLSELRMAAVGNDTTAIQSCPFDAPELEHRIRGLLKKALAEDGYPTPGRPRGRQLYPKGVLLRLSTSGVYWPWVGEGNLDAGMHPLKKPPVLAHELAHAYGFGEEGTCSFWAWRAGQQAEDAWLTYAIRLDYWRNLARQWLRTDREGYLKFYRESLAPGIRQDIIAIIQTNRQYPDILPQVRDVAYDTYLKSQGVKDGLLSYGRVVKLVEGYRRK